MEKRTRNLRLVGRDEVSLGELIHQAVRTTIEQAVPDGLSKTERKNGRSYQELIDIGRAIVEPRNSRTSAPAGRISGRRSGRSFFAE